MLVLLLVLPLPLRMYDTECAIFFFPPVYIPQNIFILSWDENANGMKGIVRRLSALGCSSAKRFPAKSLADLSLLFSHDMTSSEPNTNRASLGLANQP